jgi:hypothetical protein
MANRSAWIFFPAEAKNSRSKSKNRFAFPLPSLQLLRGLVPYQVQVYPRTIARSILQPPDFLLFYAFVLPLISAFSRPSILRNAEIHLPLLDTHFYKIQI